LGIALLNNPETVDKLFSDKTEFLKNFESKFEELKKENLRNIDVKYYKILFHFKINY